MPPPRLARCGCEGQPLLLQRTLRVGTPTRRDRSSRWRSARLNRWISTGLVVSCLMAREQLSAQTLGERAPNPVAAEPIVVKPGDPQLFVDDYLIQSQARLQRRLHQPAKDDRSAKPLLSLSDLHITAPGTLEANGSILYDIRLKKYVMFALALRTPWDGWDKTQLFRFTSADGINWTVGDEGSPRPVFPRRREDLRDPESGLYASNIDLCSFLYDARDQAAPYKGWVWFANMGDLEGLYYVWSPDGLDWKRGPLVTGIHDFAIKQDDWELFGAGDVTTVTYDPFSGRYLAQIKLANKTAVGPGNRQRCRAFLFVDHLEQRLDPSRLQRVALVPPGAARDGDLPWDEYYASTAWRYGSLWLGGLKIWHSGGDYSYSAAGCAFIKLMCSRDGLDWHKVPYLNDENTQAVWIANGAEGGNDEGNDGGYITEFNQGPLRIGDELIYYYGSSSWGKNHPRGLRVTGGGIFRARLRPDGFVSVVAGQLITKPLLFEGEDLLINGNGPIDVRVLKSGKPVASAHLQGGSLGHKVTLDGKSLQALVGRAAVQLQFEVQPGGQLYSFTTR